MTVVEAIKEFHGEFRFLSNFWPAEVVLNCRKFPTVEHAYQAAKCANVGDQQAIQMIAKPGAAKRFGRLVCCRLDWSRAMQLDVMEGLLRQKFSVEPLRSTLLATGDAELIEGNQWGDTFWGVSGGVGENHLGRLLMEVREMLRRNEGDEF